MSIDQTELHFIQILKYFIKIQQLKYLCFQLSLLVFFYTFVATLYI